MTAQVVSQEYGLHPLGDAIPWPGNARRGDLELIERSMLENGVYGAILVQRSTRRICKGNHTHAAAKALGVERLPMLFADLTDDQALSILLVDNRAAMAGGFDQKDLLALIDAAKASEGGLSGTGYTEADAEALREAIAAAAAGAGGQPEKPAGPTLRDRFLVPPFSVLDARQGYWQDRKRQWIALGIQSEVGRGEAPGGSAFPADHIGPDGKFERGGHHAGKGGAYTQPAAVGRGGLSDQLAPRTNPNAFGPGGSRVPAAAWQASKNSLGNRVARAVRDGDESGSNLAAAKKVHVAPGGAPMPLDRAKGAGAPPPNGTHGTNEPFGAPYGGGDAWRGRKDAAASFKSQARRAALQATGSSQPTSDQPQATGTSIFDPTLTELLVRWFSAEGGEVLDPFAGGSVRGIVAAKLGRHYTGIELRPEQVAANEQQRVAICGPDGGPRWICGDSLAEIPKLPADYAADMLLSCPPYFDLEVYSQEAADLSAMDYPGFLQAYRAIIAAAVARLRDDRFACWVVGEVRDARGIYRNFVGDTIAAFEAAGARYYNEAILVTAVGSLPVRAGRIFETARKLGKSHQNVLVFCKGDPKRAAAACGHVDLAAEDGSVFDGGDGDEETDDAEVPAAAGPAPDWARGYVVDDLRAVTDLFRAHDEPYVFGRFGRITEAQVAEWAAQGALRCVRRGGVIVAAAVVHGARTASAWADFAGTPLAAIDKGDARITRMACTPDGAGQLAALLQSLVPPRHHAYAKAYQESPRVRAALRAAGFAWLGSDVTAASEVVGVWGTSSGAGHSRPEDAPALARLRLPRQAVEAAARAVAASNPAWAQHYSPYNQRDSWTALALRGYGGQAGFIEKPAEMSKAWKKANPEKMAWQCADTELAAALPEVIRLAAAIPGAKDRIRLMRLAAGGGELSRHADITDPDAGTAEGRCMRIHIPLATNPGVQFTQWLASGQSVTVHMGEGEAWYLDTRKPHTAVNAGASDRVHLVMDVHASPELLGLIEWQKPPPVPAEAPPPSEPLGERWEPSRVAPEPAAGD